MVNKEQARILVVDDEEDLCEILQFNLESENYTVDTAISAEDALTLDLKSYDLILLDVMMGEISGFKMANGLKKNPETSSIPIIFLTAKTTENDLLTGFSLGADDYIKKPFSVKEVIVRVKAVLARSTPEVNSEVPEISNDIFTFETLTINRENKLVKVDDLQVKLTKKEYEILILLISRPGKVYSRDEILDKIWRDESYVITRTVDVNITRLRKKIGIYGNNIVTRQGYGYCFQ